MEHKPGKTAMNTQERAEMLTHCRYVDEVHRCPPYIPTIEFVNSLKVGWEIRKVLGLGPDKLQSKFYTKPS
jgi:glycerol-3-phosphate cytidylyltransferase-like family protein